MHDGVGYRTLEMSGVITVNSVEALPGELSEWARHHPGAAAGVRHLLEAGSLVEVAPDLRAELMPVSLVYVQRRNLSRRVQVFMSWVAK